MADNTSTEAAKGGAIGRIVRIVGAVVDVEFRQTPCGHLQRPYREGTNPNG